MPRAWGSRRLAGPARRIRCLCRTGSEFQFNAFTRGDSVFIQRDLIKSFQQLLFAWIYVLRAFELVISRHKFANLFFSSIAWLYSAIPMLIYISLLTHLGSTPIWTVSKAALHAHASSLIVSLAAPKVRRPDTYGPQFLWEYDTWESRPKPGALRGWTCLLTRE